jgi:hypothetical protein
MTSRWRYRLLAEHPDDHGPWVHAPTLTDIRHDVEGQPAEVQRRNREGEYEPYAVWDAT